MIPQLVVPAKGRYHFAELGDELKQRFDTGLSFFDVLPYYRTASHLIPFAIAKKIFYETECINYFSPSNKEIYKQEGEKEITTNLNTLLAFAQKETKLIGADFFSIDDMTLKIILHNNGMPSGGRINMYAIIRSEGFLQRYVLAENAPQQLNFPF